MPGHKKLTDMKLKLDRIFWFKNGYKGNTHTLIMSLTTFGHTYSAYRDVYTHSSFNELYADMLEEVMRDAVMYLRHVKQADIDERRSRNE